MADDLVMVEIRPSALARVSACPGSHALCAWLPRDDAPRPAADRGTAIHAALQALSLGQHELACERVAALDESAREGIVWTLRALAEAVSIDGDAMMLVEAEADCGLVADGLTTGHMDLAFVAPWRDGVAIDYKTGQGAHVAPARNNLQTAAYAVALARRYDLAAVQVVIAYVDRRRLDIADLDLAALERAADRIRAVVDAARQPWAPLRTGPHCCWCPALATCPAAIGTVADAIGGAAPTPAALDRAEVARQWAGAVQQAAHGMLMAGGTVPGWRLRERAGRRRWAAGVTPGDVADAARRAGKPVSVADVEAPAAPISPAQLDQIIGRSRAVREALDGMVDRSAPSLTLERAKEQTT